MCCFRITNLGILNLLLTSHDGNSTITKCLLGLAASISFHVQRPIIPNKDCWNSSIALGIVFANVFTCIFTVLIIYMAHFDSKDTRIKTMDILKNKGRNNHCAFIGFEKEHNYIYLLEL